MAGRSGRLLCLLHHLSAAPPPASSAETEACSSSSAGEAEFLAELEMVRRSWLQTLELRPLVWPRSCLGLNSCCCRQVKAANPENIAAQVFDRAYYDSLSPELRARLLACVKSGVENPDSSVGA